MKLKREIDRKVEGNIETIKIKVIDFKEKLPDYDLLLDLYFNDPEDAYYNGVGINFDNDVAYIEIDKFLDKLQSIQEELESDGEKDEIIDELVTKLKKYDGYTLWMDD